MAFKGLGLFYSDSLRATMCPEQFAIFIWFIMTTFCKSQNTFWREQSLVARWNNTSHCIPLI